VWVRTAGEQGLPPASASANCGKSDNQMYTPAERKCDAEVLVYTSVSEPRNLNYERGRHNLVIF